MLLQRFQEESNEKNILQGSCHNIDLFSFSILQYKEYVKSINFEKPTPSSVYYMKQTIRYYLYIM